MRMKEESEKRKKVSFSEEDVFLLSERYNASTVLKLLQEMANYPHSKFEWDELVKKTSTGISNAGEYQMLWRHLAYGHALVENFEDAAQPLDDDSDLECEREALPPVTKETALEAAACVKLMIASHTLSESSPTSAVIEAPLTINVPVCGSSKIPNGSSQPFNLVEETNITFPVTVPRRMTRPNKSSTRAMKTKGWSEEEDKQLLAAVQ
ncbi:uncharacterized protein LOC133294003 [Gastrolobium bilobum]|uniref:uncharacterized protein LOC133294003 n=1 Tax=Gastrolobium bilobum TaxID=150636 RepID=UPI002AB1C169|nr:uncharacterized protein LOC133294003 [Gastrolobium bilobum]